MATAPKGTFVFNDRFFEQLGKSAPVVALVVAAAHRVEGTAKQTAPVGETHGYVNGIHVETKEAKYRTVALVVASDPKSMLIESKTGNLARAVKANGGTTQRRAR